MKASEFVAALQALIAEHGDLEVETFGPYTGRRTHQGPKLRHRLVLKGRASTPRFYGTCDEPAQRGEAVFEA